MLEANEPGFGNWRTKKAGGFFVMDLRCKSSFTKIVLRNLRLPRRSTKDFRLFRGEVQYIFIGKGLDLSKLVTRLFF